MKSSDPQKPRRSKTRGPKGSQIDERAGSRAAVAVGTDAPPAWAAVSSRRAAVLLAALGLAVYGNSFSVPFVYDGVAFILENASLRQLNPLALTEGQTRPVSYYSFALNYAVGGYNVWGYHAVNLAIHLAAAWTLYGLVRRTLESAPRCAGRYGAATRGLALAIAALWLVHPLQTASVTYVYQRQESLMGLLYLLTVYCVLRGIQATEAAEGRSPAAQRAARNWYLAAVASSLTGMGTKEVMVTAPLMTLWYDRSFWAASWRELWNRRKWLYAALGATAAVPFAVLFVHKAKYQSVGLLVSGVYSPWQYARSQPGVICHYLWLCLDPRGLCLDPNWPVAENAIAIIPPAIVVGLLLGLTAWCVWKRPAWGYVGAWFFVILSPTSSVVPILDLAYDHRMYLSLASVFVLFVIGLYEAWRWIGARSGDPLLRRAWLPPAVLAAVVGAFGVQTILRNFDYRTATAIWQDTVDKAPHNARAHYSLGREFHEQADGKDDLELAALEETSLAIEIVAGTRAGAEYLDARTVRASVLGRLGNRADSVARFCDAEGAIAETEGRFMEAQACLDEARELYDKAAEYFAQAKSDLDRVIDKGDDKHRSEAWAILGNQLFRRQQPQEAIDCYDRAIAIDPTNALAYKSRGSTLWLMQERIPDALRDMRRAVELDGSRPDSYFMLAVSLAAQEKVDEAIQVLQQAVAKGTVSADNYGTLGALLAKKDRCSEAEAALRQSLAIKPDSIASLMSLADLLAKRGRKSEAADFYRRVLAINPGYAAARGALERIEGAAR